MLNKIQYIILLGILAISCSENSTDPYKDLTPLSLDEAVHQVSMNIVDYDSILIESKDSFVLEHKSVDTIFVSYQIRGDDYYGETDFIVPKYEGKSGKYHLKFIKKIGIFPLGRIVDLDLLYTNNDGIIGAHDSTFYMYKYPYNSTEIFFNLKENLSQGVNTLQGFEIVGNHLYFCPSGPGAGIWRYNFSTKEEADLYGTGSGDHIAANETYAFLDPVHSSIIRYNIDTKTMDLEFDLSNLGDMHSIEGLTIYDDHLYALIQKNSGESVTLIKFDLSGNVIEEILSFEFCYYFTIYDDIAYIKSYQYDGLIRYNLKTNEFLESMILPSYYGMMEGFRIYDDKFYYVNFGGPYLYFLDLDELEPIQTTTD